MYVLKCVLGLVVICYLDWLVIGLIRGYFER